MTDIIKKNYLNDLKLATTAADQSISLELFYRDTSYLVFNYCRKKGLSIENAEDITQIVYTQIYKKRKSYNSDYSPLSWLFIITKSETKDYLKKQAIYKGYIEDYTVFLNISADLSLTEHSNPTTDKDVNAVINNLNIGAFEKRILEERYILEKEFAEIGQSLGLSASNVRQIISRTLKKLKV